MAAPDAIHETLAASQRHLLETFKKIALFRHFRLPKDKHVIIPGAGRGARPAARSLHPPQSHPGGGGGGKEEIRPQRPASAVSAFNPVMPSHAETGRPGLSARLLTEGIFLLKGEKNTQNAIFKEPSKMYFITSTARSARFLSWNFTGSCPQGCPPVVWTMKFLRFFSVRVGSEAGCWTGYPRTRAPGSAQRATSRVFCGP